MPINQDAIYLELNVKPENGAVYVHSRHVPGLHMVGKDFQSMKPSLETAIKQLFRDNQKMNVKIVWLTSKEDAYSTAAICNVLERLMVYPEDAAVA
jgi:hypothetical protein